jgi:hypothetical protein
MGYWMVALVILALFGILSLFVPRNWRVVHQTHMAHTVAELYAFLVHLKNWPRWQSVNENEVPFLYMGHTEGEGAVQYWEIDGVPACLRMERCEPYEKLHCQVRINKGDTVIRWTFELRESKGGTELTWICQGTSRKNPLDRCLTFFYKWRMKRDMRDSLERLRLLHVKTEQRSA